MLGASHSLRIERNWKDILFCNGYPIKLFKTIIDKRQKIKAEKSSTIQILTDVIPLMDEKKLFTVLPYIPKLSDKLKRILRKHKLNVTFKHSNTIQSFFSSGHKNRDFYKHHYPERGWFYLCHCWKSSVFHLNF